MIKISTLKRTNVIPIDGITNAFDNYSPAVVNYGNRIILGRIPKSASANRKLGHWSNNLATLLILTFFLLVSGFVSAGVGDKVTVSGGATTAAGANGDYFYAGTTTVGGTVRDYYDMPSSVYRVEYRANPSYGNEWEVWESTARGGGGTVRFYHASSSATIPTGAWSVDVGSGSPVITFTAAPTAPTSQATAVVFSSTTTSSTTVAWTKGNGTSRAVFMKLVSTGNASPVNSTTYTANSIFGSGTQISSSGWYCVYNGTGTTVGVTGLTAGSIYRVSVCEYNGGSGSELYNTNTASGNPNNVTTTNPTVAFNATSSNGLESVSSANLQVNLSAVSGQNVTIDYVVTGTASGGGTDYTLVNGTLTINAGNLNSNITIAGIVNDLLDEDNETVIVTLSNPVNSSLGTNTVHTYTINDDDATPTVSFNSASQSSTDETGTMTITAQLSAVSGRTVSVPFTVNGSSTATGSGTDYSISTSPLTISAGSSSASITITIASDVLDEDNETVIVDMGSPTNATQGSTTSHTATITDDDATPTVSFTSATQSSTDETGTMTITAQLSAVSGRTVSVPFTVNGSSTATGSGTDYSISSSPLTISAGSSSASITITIASDVLDEDNETVIVDLGSPTNATQGSTTSHTATITDDDTSPTVTTTAVSTYDTNSATMGGNVTSAGTSNVTERGVVYSSTDATPTIGETGVTQDTNGSGTGSFSESISLLTSGTTYYVQAYSTSAAGTSYGGVQSFTSTKPATVTTQAVSSISTTTATGNGTITDLGSPNPSEHGVCWNTAGTPTTSDSKTTDGSVSATGAYTSSITGLTPNATYYVRAYVTNDAGTSYGDQVSFTSSAAATSSFSGTGNWSNSANWTDGAPGSTTAATISSGTATVNGNYECASLTISSGAVVSISSGNTLTVSGTLTNNAGSSGLVVTSGAGLITSSSVSGTVERYISQDVWHYLGLPISSISNVNDVFHNCYVLSSNEGSATDGNETGWTYLAQGDGMSMGVGYAVQYNRTSNNDTTIAFTGTLNTGNINVGIAKSGEGWNLISNPYPCAVDWETIDNSLVNQTIYVYNGSTYDTYLNGTGAQSRYIAPMQGFFVKANGSETVAFSNSTKSPSSSTFKSELIDPIIRIGITQDNIKFDDTFIRINSTATEGFEGELDAYKLKATNSDCPQVWSLLNGNEYSINSIPEITEDLVITLEVMIKTTGEHKLVLKDLENYDYGYPLSIINSKGELVADLQTEDYKFDAQAGETVKLYLAFTSTVVGINNLKLSDIKLSSLGTNIVIERLNNVPSKVLVSNLNGQRIFYDKVKVDQLIVPVTKKGIYLVKVLPDNGILFNGKAVINF